MINSLFQTTHSPAPVPTQPGVLNTKLGGEQNSHDDAKLQFSLANQQIHSNTIEEQPKTEEDAFKQFVGETFYSIMVKQMRATTGKTNLFGDSSATRTYQQQFDTHLIRTLAENDEANLSQAMFELHKLGRPN